LDFEGIIIHEFPLERINEALDMVRGGSAGRVLIRVQQ
jgi:Zn-dependent alcohol dehydrogenase